MITGSKYFEIGIVVVSENSKLQDIEDTIWSSMSQKIIPRKICILSIGRDYLIEKNWLTVTNIKLRERGVQEFRLFDIIDNGMNFKECIHHIFSQFIVKPMKVIIHLPDGDKKSSIKLTHFCTIPAGNTFTNRNIFSVIRRRYFSKNKNIVTYFNLVDGDGLLKVNRSSLTDKMPLVYHLNGFKFFVDIKDKDRTIMEAMRSINLARNREMRDVGEEDSKDSIFKKSPYAVKVSFYDE